MLILEGADMLGKTTFANNLKAAWPDVQMDKCGLPEAEYRGVAPWLARYGHNTVCDRHFLSEPIYGLVCRGKSNLTTDEFWELQERLVDETPGVDILVWIAGDDTYKQVVDERYDAGREAFSPAQCHQVSAAYQELMLRREWRGYHLHPRVRYHAVHVARTVVTVAPIGSGIPLYAVTNSRADQMAATAATAWRSCLPHRQILAELMGMA